MLYDMIIVFCDLYSELDVEYFLNELLWTKSKKLVNCFSLNWLCINTLYDAEFIVEIVTGLYILRGCSVVDSLGNAQLSKS